MVRLDTVKKMLGFGTCVAWEGDHNNRKQCHVREVQNQMVGASGPSKIQEKPDIKVVG